MIYKTHGAGMFLWFYFRVESCFIYVKATTALLPAVLESELFPSFMTWGNYNSEVGTL